MTLTLDEIEKRLMSLEKLAKKIQVLEDTEDIKSLMRYYVNCLISVKWDELAECFTDKARIEIGVAGLREGKPAIARLFKEEIGTRHIGKEFVFVVHPIITVDGDKAKGSWLLLFMFTEATHIATMSLVQGPYDCEYEKINGKWKISHLKWRQTLGPKPVKLMESYGVQDQ